MKNLLALIIFIFPIIAFSDPNCSEEHLKSIPESELSSYESCKSIKLTEEYEKLVNEIRVEIDIKANSAKSESMKAQWSEYREGFNRYIAIHKEYADSECGLETNVPGMWGSGNSATYNSCAQEIQNHVLETLKSLNQLFKSTH